MCLGGPLANNAARLPGGPDTHTSTPFRLKLSTHWGSVLKGRQTRVLEITSPSHSFVRGDVCYFSLQEEPCLLSFYWEHWTALPVPALPTAFSPPPFATLEKKLTNGSNYHSGLRLLNLFFPFQL